MKLIVKLSEKAEALSVKYRLECAGIPIFIGSENTGPAAGAMLFADCYTIWAEVDEQQACAVKALEDENYLPEEPLDISEYRQILEQVRDDHSKRSAYYSITAFILVAVGYFIYRVFLALGK